MLVVALSLIGPLTGNVDVNMILNGGFEGGDVGVL